MSAISPSTHSLLSVTHLGKSCLESKCFSFPSAFHIFSSAAQVFNRMHLNGAVNLSHRRNETQDPLPFFIFHALNVSEESHALQFGFLSCFHVIRHELCLSDMFLVFPSGGPWSQFVPELVVTWATWWLPSFSSVKLVSFPSKLIIDLWGFTSRLYKYSVSIKLSTNNFSIHWWHSPESMITMVVVKWWFF